MAGLTKLVEVAAEYMGNIPLEGQARHPKVPWKIMADMRNISSHEYHRLDPEIVENTIIVDLPKLITQIDQMLTLIHSWHCVRSGRSRSHHSWPARSPRATASTLRIVAL